MVFDQFPPLSTSFHMYWKIYISPVTDIVFESSLHNLYLSLQEVSRFIYSLFRLSSFLHLHLPFMTKVDLTGKSIWDQSFHLVSPEEADWWRQSLPLIFSYFVHSIDLPCWAPTAALCGVYLGEGVMDALNGIRKEMRTDEQGKKWRRQSEGIKEVLTKEEGEQGNAEQAVFTHYRSWLCLYVCVCV